MIVLLDRIWGVERSISALFYYVETDHQITVYLMHLFTLIPLLFGCKLNYGIRSKVQASRLVKTQSGLTEWPTLTISSQYKCKSQGQSGEILVSSVGMKGWFGSMLIQSLTLIHKNIVKWNEKSSTKIKSVEGMINSFLFSGRWGEVTPSRNGSAYGAPTFVSCPLQLDRCWLTFVPCMSGLGLALIFNCINI